MSRFLWRPALGTVLTATAISAHAQEVRTSVDVAVSGGYANNPFLTGSGGDTGDSVFVEASATPSLTIFDDTSSTTASATLRGVDYLSGGNGTSWSLGASLQSTRAISSRLSLNGSLQFTSSIAGERGVIGLAPVLVPVGTPQPPADGGSAVPTTPVLPIPPIATPPLGVITPDITLLGRRQRQTSFGSQAGLSYRTSERDSVSLSANALRSTFSGNAFNTTSYGVTGSYNRILSESTSVGGNASVQFSDFGLQGTGRSYSAQVTLARTLSPVWSGSIGIGPLYTETRSTVLNDNSWGLSLDAQACRRGEFSNLCLSANRGSNATAVGTVSQQFTAGASYDRRLGERDSLRAAITYSQTGNERDLAGAGAFEYLTGIAGWDRSISRRISGGVSLSYREALGGAFSQSADYSASLYLRTRLGNLQ